MWMLKVEEMTIFVYVLDICLVRTHLKIHFMKLVYVYYFSFYGRCAFADMVATCAWEQGGKNNFGPWNMQGPSCRFCRQQSWLLLELFVGMHFWSHLRDYVLVLQSCRSVLAMHYWAIHPSVYLFFFRLARSWWTPWFACVYGCRFCVYIMPVVKLVCFDVSVKVALHTCYTICQVVAVHCLYKVGVYVWGTCLNFFHS